MPQSALHSDFHHAEHSTVTYSITELCEEFGVTRAECVAYGDSLSDKDLFSAVPVSVAVNADRHLTGLATHSYMGMDLWEAYELVRSSR